MNETIFYATFEANYNGQKTESSRVHYTNEEKTLFDFVEWIGECQEQIKTSIGDPNVNVLVTSINFIKNTH